MSFSWICPVIHHEFRHNIVKVDEAITSWIYLDNVMAKFIVNYTTDAWKTDANLFSSYKL